MAKDTPREQSVYIYNNDGLNEVSEQIMDAYNFGFIDQYESKQVLPEGEK